MSQFPLFQLFPAELREMVWEEALPQDLGVCLFPYNGGLWQPRTLSPGDEHFNAEHPEFNLLLEFRSDQLEPIRIDLSLAFVNHEARRVALRWLRRNDMKLLPGHGNRPYPLATRSFKYDRDILFVSPEKWRTFAHEHHNRHNEPDLHDRSVTRYQFPLRNIAVMERSVEEEHASDWCMVFQTYDANEKLFVIDKSLQGDDDADWQNHLDYASRTGRWCELGLDLVWEYTWDSGKAEMKRCKTEEKEGEGFSAIAGTMLEELNEWLRGEAEWILEFDVYRARVVVREA